MLLPIELVHSILSPCAKAIGCLLLRATFAELQLFLGFIFRNYGVRWQTVKVALLNDLAQTKTYVYDADTYLTTPDQNQFNTCQTGQKSHWSNIHNIQLKSKNRPNQTLCYLKAHHTHLC